MALEDSANHFGLAVAAHGDKNLTGFECLGQTLVGLEVSIAGGDTEVATDHAAHEARCRAEGKQATHSNRADSGDNNAHEAKPGEKPHSDTRACRDASVPFPFDLRILFESDPVTRVHGNAKPGTSQTEAAKLVNCSLGCLTVGKNGSDMVVSAVELDLQFTVRRLVQTLDHGDVVTGGDRSVRRGVDADGLARCSGDGKQNRLIVGVAGALEASGLCDSHFCGIEQPVGAEGMQHSSFGYELLDKPLGLESLLDHSQIQLR